MCAGDRIIAKAQMNQSWYDTHMKMKRKRNEIFIDKQTPIATDDENDTDDDTWLMGMSDAPDLRDRLFATQQELCAYHTLLDEMEELKAANKQLECEAAELLKEPSSHKQTLNKDGHNALESLENEIVGLKIELAQSREKVDSHVARMRPARIKMKYLGEEVKALRESADIQQITNKRIEVPVSCHWTEGFIWEHKATVLSLKGTRYGHHIMKYLIIQGILSVLLQ
mmetsp:Transcript_27319/g.39564  ORF Transcript_27319/g.39564 Transcript_27319/m.39564 type:complete len:226 (+) Transcript_27319:251-928(+)